MKEEYFVISKKELSEIINSLINIHAQATDIIKLNQTEPDIDESAWYITQQAHSIEEVVKNVKEI